METLSQIDIQKPEKTYSEIIEILCYLKEKLSEASKTETEEVAQISSVKELVDLAEMVQEIFANDDNGDNARQCEIMQNFMNLNTEHVSLEEVEYRLRDNLAKIYENPHITCIDISKAIDAAKWFAGATADENLTKLAYQAESAYELSFANTSCDAKS